MVRLACIAFIASTLTASAQIATCGPDTKLFEFVARGLVQAQQDTPAGVIVGPRFLASPYNDKVELAKWLQCLATDGNGTRGFIFLDPSTHKRLGQWDGNTVAID